MLKYTGANFKQRVLITLRENPIDPMRTDLRLKPHMGEFTLHFSCKNLTYVGNGALPLADLAEIEAALVENRLLQTKWEQAVLNQIGLNARQAAIERDITAERSRMLQESPNTQPGVLVELESRLLFRSRYTPASRASISFSHSSCAFVLLASKYAVTPLKLTPRAAWENVLPHSLSSGSPRAPTRSQTATCSVEESKPQRWNSAARASANS